MTKQWILLVWLSCLALAACSERIDIPATAVPASAVPTIEAATAVLSTTTATPLPMLTATPQPPTPTRMGEFPVEGESAAAPRTVTFATADDVILPGTVYGSGETAVIFSTMGEHRQDTWAEMAQTVADQGYLAFTYDFRFWQPDGSINGDLRDYAADDLLAAIAYMREQGARQIVLVGASLGGMATLDVADEVEPAAVIVLAAPLNESFFPTLHTTPEDIQAIQAPILFIGSEEEDFAPDLQQMAELANAPKEIELYPGDAHGTELFATPHGPAVSERILSFIQRTAPVTAAAVLYQADAGRSGFYDMAPIRQPVSPIWQKRSLGVIAHSSPLVAGDTLYVPTANGHLYAYEPTTGDVRWEFTSSKGGIMTGIAVQGDVVYVGSEDDKVHALDRVTGEELWSLTMDDYSLTTPLLVENILYFGSNAGSYYALDVTTEQLIWQVDLGQRSLWPAALADGLLFIPVGSSVYALDSLTGEVGWQVEMSMDWGALAAAAGRVYGGNENGRFYALDADSGETLWEFESSPDADWSGPAVAHDLVYVGSLNQHIYALNSETGEVVWQKEVEDWAVSTPIVVGDVVYVGVGNHDNREGPRSLYALDAQSGEELWTFEADGRLLTTPAIYQNSLFIGTANGFLYALQATALATETAELSPGAWHDMVYDEQLQQVILVNGGPEEGKSADEPLELWRWDGTEWLLLNNSGPRWRNFASIAYDSDRDVLVLYGGLQSLSEQFEETWEWDGAQWRQHEVPGPGPREAAGMSYDAARRQVILFGGAQEDSIMGDTWGWDGQQWTELSSSGPSPRFPGGFVYDAAREAVLLAGGHFIDFQSGEFLTFGDSWLWDGTSWQEVTAAGPSPRDGARAIYDSQRQQVLLFGGIEVEGGTAMPLADTWIWDGTSWTEVATTGPGGRGHQAMAYDVARDKVVLFGGAGEAGELWEDTWEWDGEQWSMVGTAAASDFRPPLSLGHDLVYDEQRQMVLLVNSGMVPDETITTPGQLWGWDGGQWHLLNSDGPPARNLAAVAYDTSRDVLLVYGGQQNNRVKFDDTWMWDGQSWTELDSAGPGARDHIAMAYDAARDQSIFVSGVDRGNSLLRGTWAFDGASWMQLSETEPTPRAHYAIIYDGAHQQVLLFGGVSNAALNDTWAWDGAWTQVATSGPSRRNGMRMAYDPTMEQVVLFGGRANSGSFFDDTWVWDGSQWTELDVAGPSPRGLHAMAYDTARARLVLFGGFNGTQNLNDTWEWDGAQWRCVDGCNP